MLFLFTRNLGSCLSLTNHRPTSLLSIVNQILDKLVYNGLSKYWDKHDIILSGQFGFRANHSTEHAILLITDKKYRQQLKTCGHFSCGIFLDLSKAVDTVDDNTLKAKLYSCGIHGIVHEWFVSYLSNRYQLVSIGNTSSTEKNHFFVKLCLHPCSMHG